MRESATQNSPLPPSIEKAYHDKCIELKRRLREVEEANDAARLRKLRLDRAIMKMRVNRAFLLEQLAKAQDPTADDSEGSSSAPPTPRERPPRLKRNYHRRSSPTAEQQQQPASSSPAGRPAELSTGASGSQAQHLPAQSNSPNSSSQRPKGVSHSSETPQQAEEGRSANENPQHVQNAPLIHSLPNGTSVVLVGPNEPKPGPWTINDLDPRHRIDPNFDQMSFRDQDWKVRHKGYLPIDENGKPVLRVYDRGISKYRHIFPDDPDWKDPVINNVRSDPIESLPSPRRSAEPRRTTESRRSTESRRTAEHRDYMDQDDDVMELSRSSSRHEGPNASNGTANGASFTAANR